MRKLFFCLTMLFLLLQANAQQALPAGKMSYTIMTKPNNIIYNDTIFKGSVQFKHLFYRTGNPQLIQSYQLHQSNKITGQVLNFAGAIALIAGISNLSGSTKGLGWSLIGSGFLASIAGGYFAFKSQQHLMTAVDMFNQQYKKSTVSLGLGQQSVGVVYKF